MARLATGGVVPPRGRRRSWAIRFQAYGKRHTMALGKPEEGWNRQRAEVELANVLADVRRGIWTPLAPDPEPTEAQRELTLGEFAEDWFDGASQEWRPRTEELCRWRLDGHLLPFFGKHRLSAITVQEVDRYRRLKVRQSKRLEKARQEQLTRPLEERERLPRPLSNESINKTIRLLRTILELAVEYGYIDRNPARGRKRFLRESKPLRTYLQPGQVAALLAGAAELDRQARDDDDGRRQPLFAMLALAGLRISEALDLRWRDVNLAERKLWVSEAKTDAGVREVDLTPVLQKMLTEYRSRSRYGGSEDRVFPTRKGKRDNPSNVRNRFLASAIKCANEELRKAGHQEIGAITPHSLRRTFISLLLAAGADVPYVMAQAGHTDPRMTLGIYAQVIASSTDHGAALDGLISTNE
jgi:integrase